MCVLEMHKWPCAKSGLGTITFELIGETRLSYLMTWPHVRPWHMSRTQPAFRPYQMLSGCGPLCRGRRDAGVDAQGCQRDYSKTDSIAAE